MVTGVFRRAAVLCLLFTALVILAGCGNSSNSHKVVLSGTAAAGAPVSGTVTIVGADGQSVTTKVQSDGTFTADVSGITAPFILMFEGMSTGTAVTMYSAATGDKTANITPLTDLVIRYSAAGDVEAVFADWDTTQLTPDQIAAAEEMVRQQILALMEALGVATGTDFITDAFKADLTGMDLVLESLDITYDGSQVTVVNNLTGDSYTDDLANPSGTAGFTETATDIKIITSKSTGAQAVWDALAAYAIKSPPVPDQIMQFMNAYTDSSFLDSGRTASGIISDWGGSWPPAGTTFTVAIVGTAPYKFYSENYEVAVSYTSSQGSGTFHTYMSTDGRSWYWMGNQQWVDVSFRYMAESFKWSGLLDPDLSSGLYVDFGDPAYAISKGITLWKLTWATGSLNGKLYDNFFVLDDAVLSLMGDNTAYRLDFTNKVGTLIHSVTGTIPGKPILNSSLNESQFPTIIKPSSYAIANANIGGAVDLNWTNPTQAPVTLVEMEGYVMDHEDFAFPVKKGATTAVLDTTGVDPTLTVWASLYFTGYDTFGRAYRVQWFFN